MERHRRVCAFIDLDAIAANLNMINNSLKPGTKVVAAIKADGYGHGAVPIAQIGETMDFIWGFATATVEEALDLRRHGIKKPIMLLGFTFQEHYREIVTNHLQPAVFKLSMAQQLSAAACEAGQEVDIHLAVDTGMSRIGFPDTSESIPVIAAIADLPNVKLKGIFTHFARADETDKTSAREQLSRFERFLSSLAEQGITAQLHHSSNSAAALGLPEANMDLVRPGISIYGLYPSEEISREFAGLKPAMTLKSHITYIKTVEKGTPVSYGGTYTAPRQIRIATIPVGYADGYPRSLSNKGYVLIRGMKAPVIGRICMDQFMVDVSQIPAVQELDEVTLIGKDGTECITMEELGGLSGRFNYEFACTISKRVPRVYIKNGKRIADIHNFQGFS